MWRPTLAVAVCAAILAVPAQAAEQGDATPVPQCQPAKRVYAEKNWRDRTPAGGIEVCQTDSRRGLRNTIEHFKLYRSYRQIAPYRGFNEGDPYLEWLAIPAYIVACETNGYRGQGRWFAANASGAVGPYQLLGWGAPYPARTFKQKLANHRIAAGLSLSNWACA